MNGRTVSTLINMTIDFDAVFVAAVWGRDGQRRQDARRGRGLDDLWHLNAGEGAFSSKNL